VSDRRQEDERLINLENAVRDLKDGHADILKAVSENTAITQPIADLVNAAKWWFKMLGFIGKWGRNLILWVAPIAAGISTIWLLIDQYARHIGGKS